MLSCLNPQQDFYLLPVLENFSIRRLFLTPHPFRSCNSIMTKSTFSSTKSGAHRERASIVLVFLTVVTIAAITSHSDNYISMKEKMKARIERNVSSPISSSLLRCIRVPSTYQSHEGVGAVVHRNQVALFIASWYGVPLEYNGIPSIHGYNIDQMFDRCPSEGYPVKDAKGLREHKCTLDTENIYFPMCRERDCECFARGISRHVEAVLARGCRDITVRGDRFKRTTHSGCLKPVLERYFGWKGPKPKWEYDVIHYRMGDLADSPGGKSFNRETLQIFVDIMCRTSKRDIVILTEGDPEVPQCEDRIVLASDTSVLHAMQIMQHGKRTAIGQSRFAMLMMMMANPEAVVMRTQAFEHYAWLDVERWYLMEFDFAVHYFESKQLARKYIKLHSSLHPLIFRAQRDVYMNYTKAQRRWSVDMMK